MHSRLRRPKATVIARPQPSLVCVGHDLRPERLGVARKNRVRVLGDLVGDERRVHPAHHDRHPPRPVLGGDLVGATRRKRLDVDGDQVGRLVVVDLVDAVVDQPAVDAWRGQPGQDAEGQRLHARLIDEPLAVVQAAERRLDEGYLHGPIIHPIVRSYSAELALFTLRIDSISPGSTRRFRPWRWASGTLRRHCPRARM